MAAIRTRLTVAYGAAMLTTLAAFAFALWVARRASLYRELEQDVVVAMDRADRLIRQALTAGEALTTRTDSLVTGTSGPKVIAPRLRASLEGIPNYLLIADDDGRLLYSSFAVRQLSDSAQILLQQAALQLVPGGPGMFFRTLEGEQLLIGARPAPPGATEIGRIVGGVSTTPAELAPRELEAWVLAIMPLLDHLAFGGAYFIEPLAVSVTVPDTAVDGADTVSVGALLSTKIVVVALRRLPAWSTAITRRSVGPSGEPVESQAVE